MEHKPFPMKHHLYGPVPSRRLGRSLGVDLVPFKTCTYDCIYCQLGKTTRKTTLRRPFIATESILTELKVKIEEKDKPDYITISGSGEPTLNSHVGQIIRSIKELTDIPVAVITNGSLLSYREVREALMPADLVIPSLDAGDEKMFQYINRPHENLSFPELMEGLIKFARTYKGNIWLEIMLISGITGFPSEVKKMATWVEKIKPAKIQLNTPNRPPAEEFVAPLSYEDMSALAYLLPGEVEIIGQKESGVITLSATRKATEEEILTLISRRPCTISDIAEGLLILPQEGLKLLTPLINAGRVKVVRSRGSVYFTKAGSEA
ncbi:MAG TPA: radical SAM protein [Syntrophales bacterium]|nr:radical SAM protein [Syntrophales bacterium]HOL59927.1 radical SAM protein [Syntrophales bacterium]HPO36245.1 radical SAM protein [Syntrophales bacterium]